MSLSEIRSQIQSIQRTQKTTRAVEMVAVSKMRQAQDRMMRSRPYACLIDAVIHRVACANPEFRHPYMVEREVNRIGYIVISSDRGLCGGLNVNLFRKLISRIKAQKESGQTISLCLIGRKANQFFKRVGGEILGTAVQLGDKPALNQLIGVAQTMFKAYDENKIDALHIVYNEFVSAMIQVPQIKQLIPLEQASAEHCAQGCWDYLYEPSAEILLNIFVQRYLESQIYQAVVENLACQQAATMIAMKAASDNAGDIIQGLKITYNKLRQAAITQEISEIVGGAEALA